MFNFIKLIVIVIVIDNIEIGIKYHLLCNALSSTVYSLSSYSELGLELGLEQGLGLGLGLGLESSQWYEWYNWNGIESCSNSSLKLSRIDNLFV